MKVELSLEQVNMLLSLINQAGIRGQFAEQVVELKKALQAALPKEQDGGNNTSAEPKP